ncbi:TetR/AcrR family transcriptional regulator [Paenibacillus thalictri]|uniref:TetR/AcrR family transcriptional regulator n=1 Tax=Paenibacillus thalictri TaxID=2527873 RepID=A0A4Q9DSY4_9BACL|nr:TetR/AcrR family transcriptional regulator [Paenibacillus thalictri]TBL78609.1 TetR/AcrR family transcriptional regulator [Paenibacillus thalictri]
MTEKTINPSLQLILDIAEKLILERGCRNTTLQDIADQGGLTKGAIYHYVKSKDELFGLILEAGLQQTNRRFMESVSDSVSQKTSSRGPIELLARRLHALSDGSNAIGLIFIYLLSQKDKPAIAEILNRYYATSIQMTQSWIEVGKQHKVIPEQVDAEKAAKMFAIFKNGLQIQNLVSLESGHVPDDEIYVFVLSALGIKDV